MFKASPRLSGRWHVAPIGLLRWNPPEDFLHNWGQFRCFRETSNLNRFDSSLRSEVSFIDIYSLWRSVDSCRFKKMHTCIVIIVVFWWQLCKHGRWQVIMPHNFSGTELNSRCTHCSRLSTLVKLWQKQTWAWAFYDCRCSGRNQRWFRQGCILGVLCSKIVLFGKVLCFIYCSKAARSSSS